MTRPRIGTTVYEIATGEPFMVISDTTIIWIRSEDGRLRQYSPRLFRLRRAPNNISDDAVTARRGRERAAAVERYGLRLVELAEANNLSPRQAAEACR